MTLRKFAAVLSLLVVSACVSGGENDVLQSVVQDQSSSGATQQTLSGITTASISKPHANAANATAQNQSEFASEPFTITPLPSLREEDPLPPAPPPPPPRVKKTYLINGLASSVESIGYGFTNLSQKIPGAKLHNYSSFVESSTIIRSQVSREIQAAYKADPTVEINLIGISFGANIVTWIAQELNRKKIPVNYLATLEGPAMAPIYNNVRLADNFSCTGLSCFRTSSRLAFGNKKTDFSSFKIKTGHIELANHPIVHNRVINQINRPTAIELPQRFVVQ